MGKPSIRERDWLYVLTMTPGLGRQKIRKLHEMAGTFQRAVDHWRWIGEELGFSDTLMQQLDRQTNADAVTRLLEKREASRAHFLCILDEDYPDLLRHIPDQPLTLFCRGDRKLLNAPAIGVVGSRKPTPYGRASCAYLVKELAQAGLAIVSGLAYGIDGEAHQAALSAGGKTIAVLGCGLNHVYPPRHRGLYEKIESFGLLLSEYPPDTPPIPGLFPERNRIISGLSLGVVVVEAAEKSGSLITADCALEQGRDVFAIPGPIFSAMSAGPHNLLKQGAKLVTSIHDILEEWPLTVTSGGESHPANGKNGRNSALTAEESAIVEAITYEGVHVDELVQRLEPDRRKNVHQLLIRLEAKGILAALPGGYFARR
ncbi:DNA-processing protein DprA [Brevibacillus sp. SAFN-007a]|uniref:DNA-processing protein DprA n=1 Tax=Brevibacillus sp. SAFN-007a TaxID=3436862 RepID=UPI003F7DE7D8